MSVSRELWQDALICRSEVEQKWEHNRFLPSKTYVETRWMTEKMIMIFSSSWLLGRRPYRALVSLSPIALPNIRGNKNLFLKNAIPIEEDWKFICSSIPSSVGLGFMWTRYIFISSPSILCRFSQSIGVIIAGIVGDSFIGNTYIYLLMMS